MKDSQCSFTEIALPADGVDPGCISNVCRHDALRSIWWALIETNIKDALRVVELPVAAPLTKRGEAGTVAKSG
ncbi:hypothetical protein IHE49_12695 [Rhodanobacter sp. 7MK24]|uniref:hypothetical protein n=1 Tax=Rhodanobacter sp. 7MK24 TaxID=2775922 RepID=UPI00177DE835|nr:hypothetical protein [Rhodanobacter sp. 7MK24]MBD8881342.1 hypothetical protein [Rhodanobacter sp. 7MK24]